MTLDYILYTIVIVEMFLERVASGVASIIPVFPNLFDTMGRLCELSTSHWDSYLSGLDPFCLLIFTYILLIYLRVVVNLPATIIDSQPGNWIKG